MSEHKIILTQICATDGSLRYLMECSCGDMSARDSKGEIFEEIDWHLGRRIVK